MSANDSDDRKARLAKLVPHVKPTSGSALAKRHEDVLSRMWADPYHRAAVKAMHEKAMATIQAQLRSGAGYEADKVLRHFLGEYNYRWMKEGTKAFPSSFDIAEAFFGTRREFAGFCLLPERDYLVSFEDFLDFATSAQAPVTAVEKAYQLADAVVYNVTSLDKPDALLLETDTDSSFGFVSASMVRRGDELSMLLVLGEQCPPGRAQKLRDSAATVLPNPNKPFLKSVDWTDNEPMYLEGTGLFRTLALVRFNLKERRVDSRQLMREMTNSFEVTSDSERLLPADPGKTHSRAEAGAEKLDAVGSVWEVAKTLILLPSYLLARVDIVRTEDRPTRLAAEIKTSLKTRRAVEDALAESRVLHRKISAIRVVRDGSPRLEGRSYHAPAFQVPVDGYWRYFTDETREGHDDAGAPVIGRTWVRPHLRHKDKEVPTEPKVVYIKASLSLARQRLEQFRRRTGASQAAGSPVPSTKPSDQGVPQDILTGAGQSSAGAYLYVMRCPAHGRDIFKVGFTDRDPEVRARELSSATASPTHFLVVQAWAVSEGLKAERAAHQALEAYRLASNREFFQAPYIKIRQAIESAIGDWSLE